MRAISCVEIRRVLSKFKLIFSINFLKLMRVTSSPPDRNTPSLYRIVQLTDVWERTNGVGRSRVNPRLRDVRNADGVLAGVKLLERVRDMGPTLRPRSLREAQEGEQAGLHPGYHLVAFRRSEVTRRRRR